MIFPRIKVFALLIDLSLKSAFIGKDYFHGYILLFLQSSSLALHRCVPVLNYCFKLLRMDSFLSIFVLAKTLLKFKPGRYVTFTHNVT